MKRKKAVRKKTKEKPKTKTRIRPRIIGDVLSENVFYLNDGRVLKNVVELKNALKDMDAATFEHHVNSERNDFASWIHDVVGDKKLSSDVKKIKTQATLLMKMQDYCR